jgi:hypothetical protein
MKRVNRPGSLIDRVPISKDNNIVDAKLADLRQQLFSKKNVGEEESKQFAGETEEGASATNYPTFRRISVTLQNRRVSRQNDDENRAAPIVSHDPIHLACLKGNLLRVIELLSQDKSLLNQKIIFSEFSDRYPALLTQEEEEDETYLPPPQIPKTIRAALHAFADSSSYSSSSSSYRLNHDQRWLIQNSFNGSTLLHFACAGDGLEIVKYLVAEGADLNLVNEVHRPAEFYTMNDEIKELILIEKRKRMMMKQVNQQVSHSHPTSTPSPSSATTGTSHERERERVPRNNSLITGNVPHKLLLRPKDSPNNSETHRDNQSGPQSNTSNTSNNRNSNTTSSNNNNRTSANKKEKVPPPSSSSSSPVPPPRPETYHSQRQLFPLPLSPPSSPPEEEQERGEENEKNNNNSSNNNNNRDSNTKKRLSTRRMSRVLSSRRMSEKDSSSLVSEMTNEEDDHRREGGTVRESNSRSNRISNNNSTTNNMNNNNNSSSNNINRNSAATAKEKQKISLSTKPAPAPAPLSPPLPPSSANPHRVAPPPPPPPPPRGGGGGGHPLPPPPRKLESSSSPPPPGFPPPLPLPSNDEFDEGEEDQPFSPPQSPTPPPPQLQTATTVSRPPLVMKRLSIVGTNQLSAMTIENSNNSDGNDRMITEETILTGTMSTITTTSTEGEKSGRRESVQNIPDRFKRQSLLTPDNLERFLPKNPLDDILKTIASQETGSSSPPVELTEEEKMASHYSNLEKMVMKLVPLEDIANKVLLENADNQEQMMKKIYENPNHFLDQMETTLSTLKRDPIHNNNNNNNNENNPVVLSENKKQPPKDDLYTRNASPEKRKMINNHMILPGNNNNNSNNNNKNSQSQKPQQQTGKKQQRRHKQSYLSFRELLWKRAAELMNRGVYDSTGPEFNKLRAEAYEVGVKMFHNEFKSFATKEHWESIDMLQKKTIKTILNLKYKLDNKNDTISPGPSSSSALFFSPGSAVGASSNKRISFDEMFEGIPKSPPRNNNNKNNQTSGFLQHKGSEEELQHGGGSGGEGEGEEEFFFDEHYYDYDIEEELEKLRERFDANDLAVFDEGRGGEGGMGFHQVQRQDEEGEVDED